MVGDKGTAREEEGILFVQSLDGGQRLRLMALPPPPPSCKLQKPLLWVIRAGTVACGVVVVVVVVFLGAIFYSKSLS